MEGASVDHALDRIEAALIRLEEAASRAPKPDQALVDRHDALRAAVSDSLRQLDDLLDGHAR
jgi:hypothetical protein